MITIYLTDHQAVIRWPKHQIPSTEAVKQVAEILRRAQKDRQKG